MYRGHAMDEARAEHVLLLEATGNELRIATEAGLIPTGPKKYIWYDDEVEDAQRQGGQADAPEGPLTGEVECRGTSWASGATHEEERIVAEATPGGGDAGRGTRREMGEEGGGAGYVDADERMRRDLDEVEVMLSRLPFGENITVYRPVRRGHPAENATLERVLGSAKYGSHLGGGPQHQEVSRSEHASDSMEDWVVIDDKPTASCAPPRLEQGHEAAPAITTRGPSSVASAVTPPALSRARMDEIFQAVTLHADAAPFKMPVTRKQAPDYRCVSTPLCASPTARFAPPPAFAAPRPAEGKRCRVLTA